MNYEKDIEIDESALDVECLDQARRMLTYTVGAAEAHKEMDLAKAVVDFVKARLDKEVREDPRAHGLGDRITEGAISSVIITNDEYDAVNRDYIEKKYQYEVATGVVKSFEHRKNMLESLIRLHSQSYFAGPSVPHNLSEERQKRVNRSIRLQRRN
jgi:hypothetical protein